MAGDLSRECTASAVGAHEVDPMRELPSLAPVLTRATTATHLLPLLLLLLFLVLFRGGVPLHENFFFSSAIHADRSLLLLLRFLHRR